MGVYMNKIGVFDSGVGGLTVLKELLKILPNENYIYIGDNKNSPYGDKTKEELFSYATRIIDYFISKDVTIVVLACNTISSTILEDLKIKYKKITFFDVITNTVKKVVENKPKKLLIMATSATIDSNIYLKNITKENSNIIIINLKSPLLVPLIEEKSPKIEEILNKYIKKYQDIDTILLGCTHYKIIEKVIKKYSNSKIIDSSTPVAKEVYLYFKNNNLFSNSKKLEIYTTGDVDKFFSISKNIIDEKVNYLELEK